MGAASNIWARAMGRRASDEYGYNSRKSDGTHSIADELWDGIRDRVWDDYTDYSSDMNGDVCDLFEECQDEIEARVFWLAYDAALEQDYVPDAWAFKEVVREYLSPDFCRECESRWEREPRKQFLDALGDDLSALADDCFAAIGDLERGWADFAGYLFDAIDGYDVEVSAVANRVQQCVPEIASELALYDAENELDSTKVIEDAVYSQIGDNAYRSNRDDFYDIVDAVADMLGLDDDRR